MAVPVYELANHILLALRGERALAFVQDVCAQEVAGLRPGEGTLAAFLDAKGRVLADALVLAGEGEVLLVAEDACASGLDRAVARVAPLAGVEVTTSALVAARRPGEAWTDGLPAREHSWVMLGDAIVVRVLWGADGYDLFAPRRASIAALAGAEPGDPGAAEAARIRAGRPRYGLDVDDGTLVNETPLLERAVAPDKGCYPGQESVARVRNLGRARRRIAVVEISDVAPGTALLLDGAVAGRITSAADGVALALVRAAIEPGAILDAGGVVATLR